MSTIYLCKKCNLKTGHFADLKKHLCKQKQCSKNLNAMNYSDDQLLILTLLPYLNDKHIIDIREIDYLKESSNIYKNKEKLFNVLDDIEKNKLKKCIYCSSSFSKQIDLRKHILTTCFYKELEKENIIKENVINNNNSYNTNSNNIIHNIHNINSNNTTQNATNITNIYLEVKTPIPFDEEWDISQIDYKTKSSLLTSKVMYTSLLEEILKNEINLNVIIGKDDESGIVYKNDIDEYINMKSKDIVKQTMEKLYKHLNTIHIYDGTCFDECLDYSRKMIRQKHKDFIENPIINDNVNHCITNMYINKKNDAIKMSQNIKHVEINYSKGY